jgi:hypothetical protein
LDANKPQHSRSAAPPSFATDRHSVKIMFNGEAYRAECVCGYRSDDFGRESDAKNHGDDHVLDVGW